MSDLTVLEAATRLRCSRESVLKLIHSPNGLRAAKVAGRWLISDDDLEEFKARQANRPKPRQRRRRAA